VNTQPSAALQVVEDGSAAAAQVPPAVEQSVEVVASAPSHVARNEHVAVPPHVPAVHAPVAVAQAASSADPATPSATAAPLTVQVPAVHLHPRGPASQAVLSLNVLHDVTPAAAGVQSRPSAVVPATVNRQPAGQLPAVGAVHGAQPFTTHCAALSSSAQDFAGLGALSEATQVAGAEATATTASVNTQPFTLFASFSDTVTVAHESAEGVAASVQVPPADAQSTGFTRVEELPAPSVQIAP